LRVAVHTDCDAIADLYLRAWRIGMPFVHLAHSEEAVRSWIRDRLVPTHRTLVAVQRETVVAMMAYSGDGEFF